MFDDIPTGSEINLTIVKQPTNVAAVKTLVRLLSKDRAVKAENQRLRASRDRYLRHEQRGGRQWAVRVVKQRPVKGQIGESGRIKATYDVLKDLKSVERFVEVAAV